MAMNITTGELLAVKQVTFDSEDSEQVSFWSSRCRIYAGLLPFNDLIRYIHYLWYLWWILLFRPGQSRAKLI